MRSVGAGGRQGQQRLGEGPQQAQARLGGVSEGRREAGGLVSRRWQGQGGTVGQGSGLRRRRGHAQLIQSQFGGFALEWITDGRRTHTLREEKEHHDWRKSEAVGHFPVLTSLNVTSQSCKQPHQVLYNSVGKVEKLILESIHHFTSHKPSSHLLRRGLWSLTKHLMESGIQG